MLGVGLWMVGLPLGFTKLYAYAWHKWVGLAVLVLTVLRLLWRWRHPPPPLPGTVTRWQAVLAPLGHWALLVLLLAMPISGWLMSSAGGVSVFWFGYIAPARPGAARPRPVRGPADAHHWLSLAADGACWRCMSPPSCTTTCCGATASSAACGRSRGT